MSPLDAFFDEKPEPLKGCMLALKDIILAMDDRVVIGWKYNTGFFSFMDRMMCYFGHHAVTGQLYIGFTEGHKMHHTALMSEGRKRVKVYYINPEEDIRKIELEEIVKEAISMYH